MKRVLFGLAAALSLLATPAVADGLPTRSAAVCCAPSWTGFYLGAGIGAGAVVHDLSIDVAGVGTVLGFDGIGGEGIFGTVIVGYDRQLTSNVVGGVFLDYDFSGISTDLTVPPLPFSMSLEHKHSWSVGARLGYLTSPSTLWYAMAGYTQAKFDLTSTAPGFSLDVPDFKGYFVGGGVESQLHGGWAIRADYRYTQFDRESLFSVPGFVDIGLEPSMHTARIALTYKFGRRDEVREHLK